MSPRVEAGTTYAPPQILLVRLADGRRFRARVFEARSGGLVARETYALRQLSTPRARALRLEYRGDGEWALREFDGTDGGWGAVESVKAVS